ncbi:hypothetical protein L3X38_030086 [Prunus dulcis]|uniref:Uncharacterized protein n=1 Tax=Prunus dulcis TaxID=3755 RepID=A0AAD4VBT0_PRUDU|nr:hypothetical protein L3X38_030086 [Prunus dulcis]
MVEAYKGEDAAAELTLDVEATEAAEADDVVEPVPNYDAPLTEVPHVGSYLQSEGTESRNASLVVVFQMMGVPMVTEGMSIETTQILPVSYGVKSQYRTSGGAGGIGGGGVGGCGGARGGGDGGGGGGVWWGWGVVKVDVVGV